MLIDASEYLWMKSDIEDIEIGEDPFVLQPELPLRVYKMENEGYEGTVTIKETEDAEENIYEGSLPYVLDIPFAFDSIVITATEPIEALHLIGEEGTLKVVLSPFLNTTEGMEYISNGYNDDGTYSTAGLDGFKFNGVNATTVYMSSNHWLGFGSNTAQINILQRDGCSMALMRQRGVCGKNLEFLKLRFDGYTVYSNRVDANRLVFELFLLSNNDMFLNIIQTPTSGNIGTSKLICGNNTYPLTLCDGSGGGTVVTFKHLDEDGKTWEIIYDYYSQEEFTKSYLIKTNEIIYTIKDDELVEVDAEISGLTFLEYGMDELPLSDKLIDLENPDILYWVSDTEPQMVRADVVAYPYPQTLETTADMSHISIIGIKMLTADYSGDVLISYSVDNGQYFTEEMPLMDFLNLDPTELYESLTEEKKMVLRFVLHDNATISRFKITYMN